MKQFRIGLSADISDQSGGFSWGDISIETLSPLPWEFLAREEPNFTPDLVVGFDAIAFGAPGVVPGSFATPEESPLIIARLGVGYDNIDLAECTRAGVAVTITPDGSKKPVATAALTLVLATMHRLHAKQNLAQFHLWDQRLTDGLGSGLNGKSVGTIGFGNIGTEFFRLITPFDCERFAYDPWKIQSDADPHEVTLVSLEELLQWCDVIVILATLTPQTHHLINAENIKLMKSNAILVNISRGPIVDEAALITALESGAIAGAGLDVFEAEPPAKNNSLLSMDNVIATPHNIAWTDELARGMGLSALGAIKNICNSEIPQFIVNREVLDTPQFLTKFARYKK